MRAMVLGAIALSAAWLGRKTRAAEHDETAYPQHAPMTSASAVGLSAAVLLPLALASLARARAPVRQDERALFDALVEHCPDVIWLKDIEGVYLACNRAAAALIGRQAHEVVGRDDHALFPSDIAQRHRQLDENVIASGRCVTEEQHMRRGDSGETAILDMLKTPVRRADGTVLGVLGVARDVTAARRHEQKLREQEQLLTEMSALAHVGGWEIDVAAGTFMFTPELARLHEFDPGEALTIDKFLAHYAEPEHRRIRDALTETLDSGAPHDIDADMLLASGAHKWVRAHWRAVKENGRVTRIWGMVQDVSERRKLDESMRMAELIYRTTPDAILITDSANNVVDANPAFLRLFGYTSEAVLGTDSRRFLASTPNSPLTDAIRSALDLQGSWEGELCCRRCDGAVLEVTADIHVLARGDEQQFRRAIHFTDLTTQKFKDQQLWTRSNFDQLTDLPNRRLFLDRLQQELKQARAELRQVALLCIDLDRFSDVNEVAGHAGGDRVLVETARRIRAIAPEPATIGRLAGDRFAVVLAASGRAQFEQKAQAIVQALAGPLPVETVNGGPASENIYSSASMGIAVYPDDSDHAEDLLKAAEQAQTQAKRSGGNRLHYFAPVQQQAALEKMRMTNELRHALARKQLQVVFQPIVDLGSGRVEKAEALLRWTHPQLGAVSPARFIPLAEQSGLILEIGNWIIDQVISNLSQWRRRFGMPLEVSVNSSPLQFENGAANAWIDRLADCGLPPASITIEITEGMLISDSREVRDCLKRLQANGSKVSLDDFGTGFSALSYLKNFSIDYLKIDKSFIHNLEYDASDKALTQAIIDIAHKLGIAAIAEGVETPEQRNILKGFGCDFLQGYLISRPLAINAFEHLLELQA